MKLRTTKQRPLRPVRPAAALQAAYAQRLLQLVDEMHRSVLYWITAAYRADPPRMAQDATPASKLQRTVRALRRRWEKQFDGMAAKLATYFAQAAEDRNSRVLKKILKDAGFTVKFRMTPAQRDVVEAIVNENVSLIKSIPQHYLTQVEGAVMRSVTAGRDLGTLTTTLQKQYGSTRRRAELIARDQNNKATAMLQRARQLELGMEKAVWVHSSAGKVPRPAHVKMNGGTFDIAKGMWDPHEKKYVLPGELINCRCFSRPLLPGTAA